MRLYKNYEMRTYCPDWMSGLKAMSLLMMAITFITVASTAQAQFHGATIQKQCNTDVRNCVTDADCSNDDGDMCTPEVCDVNLAPRTTNCNIRATNTDEFGDSVSVSGAFDEILTAAGIVREPLVGSMIVSAVGGSTDCIVGDPLPCQLNAAGSYVQFNIQYTLLEADSDLLAIIDQGTVTWNDNCDDPTTTGCSTQDNTVQAPAGSAVVDACTTGEREVCEDDGNLCTEHFECDAVTGECPDPGDPLVCEDDGNLCTDESCDPLTGLCESVDNGESCEPVPTLSVGGLVAMILTLLGLGGIFMRRKLLS